MADAVTNTTIAQSNSHITIHMTCISDGTGESAVIKIDRSTLTAIDSAEPSSLDISWVRWAIQGFASVRLLWDHTTDDVGLVLSGNGYDDFHGSGTNPVLGAVRDPNSAGGTGDLLLTSNGAVNGATYDITLCCQKMP